jgi:hypothetical protein
MAGTLRPISSHPAAGIVVACLFVSGASALVYEVVWLRMLSLVFGHTVHATTAVLAAFMGGLGLGSYGRSWAASPPTSCSGRPSCWRRSAKSRGGSGPPSAAASPGAAAVPFLPAWNAGVMSSGAAIYAVQYLPVVRDAR